MKNLGSGPLAALDVTRRVSTSDGVHQVTLALGIVSFVSRRTLGNVEIVDQAGGDVVDET